MAQQDTVRWIDLSEYQIDLLSIRFPDGQRRLVLRGNVAPYAGQIEEKLGFTLTRAGFFVRDEVKFSIREFQSVFPKLRDAMLPVNKVVRVASKGSDKSGVTQELALKQATPLGLNHLGQEVFAGVMGRFIRAADGGAVLTEAQGQSPAVFLRVRDQVSLDLCAQGFVERMLAGRVQRSGDFENFVRVVYDMPAIAKADDRYAGAYLAVEMAMAKAWAERGSGFQKSSFDLATRLHDALPLRKFAVRRESAPLPVVVAAAKIAASFSPESVGVLQGGSGVVAHALPNVRVIASESDPQYGEVHSRVSADNLSWEKVPPASVPVSMSLAATRAALGNTYSGVYLNRTDHISAMYALAARPDEGRTVLLLGGDSPDDSGAGDVTQSRDFYDWLYRRYEVLGAVELEAAVTRKNPQAWPYRLVVVGDKLAQPDMDRQGPVSVEVVSSFDELWSFAQTFEPAMAAPAIQERAPAVADFPVASSPSGEAPAELSKPKSVLEDANAYQVPYSPFSQASESSSMIPKNLMAPTNKALLRVSKERGEVDAFVSSSLGLSSPKELKGLFSAEQVDALALAIDANMRGKGFIEGDMTGLGKGRVLAGVTRWAIASGKPVVFISEKANLFSDFWRDLTDTQAAPLIKPFLVNAASGVIDAQGKKLFRSAKKEEQDAVFSGKTPVWGSGYNLVMGTYSQFSRPKESYAKSAWLIEVCKGAVVILDESHNAAGDSQVNRNFVEALEGAASVVYSSATFAKTPQNMAVYAKAFPAGLSTDELKDTLEAGGEPLNEVLSAALAEDGVFIRREHDMSQLTFETVIDTKRVERNERLADEMADVLSLMAKASRQAEMLMDSAAAREKNVIYTAPNFGSMRYLASRHFMLSLNMDMAIEQAILDLQNGQKPVLVVESTMESLIRDAVLNEGLDDDVLADEESLESMAKPVDEREIRAITFRDVLAKVFDRCISVRRRDGETSERMHALDLPVPENQKKELVQLRERAMAIIQRFDEIPASPLDAYRNALAQAGYSSSEISGRSLMLEQVDAKTQRVKSIKSVDRAQIVRAFNSGETDSTALTRSGSTGISLHNSSLFEDKRPRTMLEAQIFNNVSERVQVYGRCNRKGQESAPTIRTLSTGLPGEVRSLAMQSKKLRALSANTTSNRENAVDLDDVVDVINPLGDEVARSYLISRPSVAERLGINPMKEKEDASDVYVVNALMSRIEMLKTAEQRDVLNDMTLEYQARLAELDAQGLNPFKMAKHEWYAKVVSKEVFEPQASEDSVLDQPIYLKKIEYTKVQKPVSGDAVIKGVAEAVAELARDLRVQACSRGSLNPGWVEVVAAMVSAASENVVAMQKEALGTKYKSVAAALNDSKSNAVKLLDEKYKTLVKMLEEQICPGRMIAFKYAGEEVRGAVVDVRLPPPGKEHLMGQYEVKVLEPGASHPRSYTLSTLAASELKKLTRYDTNGVKKLFNDAKSGQVTVSRWVLDGNLFRSAQYAVRHDLGHAITYVDEAGQTQRAVLLKTGIEREQVMSLPVRVGSVDVAERWLSMPTSGAAVYSHPEFSSRPKETISISRMGNGQLRLEIPKAAAGAYLKKDKRLLELVGKFTSGSVAAANFYPSKLVPIYERLAEAGLRFYAPPHARRALAASASEELETAAVEPVEKRVAPAKRARVVADF